jgi:hypothetical protein
MGKNVKCSKFLGGLQLLKRQILTFLPRWWFITPRSGVQVSPRYQIPFSLNSLQELLLPSEYERVANLWTEETAHDVYRKVVDGKG